MMPAHLLQVTPYYPPDYTFGGPVRLVAELSQRLSTQADVTVATYRHSAAPLPDDGLVRVERFQPWSRPLARRYNLYGSFGLNHFIKKTLSTYQLVHTHDYRSFHNHLLANYCVRYHIPLIMSGYKSITPTTGQATLKWWFDRLGGRSILKAVSHFVAVNRFEVDDLMTYGIKQERITIIPNATDVPLVQANPSAFRARHKIQPDQPLILFYSRLHTYKRPDLAVAALPAVLKKLPDTVLVLYGPDHGALADLQIQIEQLCLTKHVRVIAQTAHNQDHDAYAAADVLVLPSPHNEFPLVLLEAMGHSIPIVTCERSIEQLIHEQCGLIAEPTAAAIAEALLAILLDKTLAQRFATQARKTYEQYFTFDQYAKQVWQLYQRYITL